MSQQISERLLREFEPKESWLNHDSYYHGVGHMTRVFILQELICNQLKGRAAVNREALRWASATHDVGRLDDGTDPEHGKRSAKWIGDNLSDRMSPETLGLVKYIVHWHVPSDSEAPAMMTELKILKDADALDRVRLGDLNPNYLRTRPAKQMIDIAEQLYQLSIPVDANDKETFGTVLDAARKLGIVKTQLSGDQSIEYAQNKTLASSRDNGDDIHLFEQYESTSYIYRCRAELVGDLYTELQKDSSGKDRQVIKFPLRIKYLTLRLIDSL